MDYDLLRALFSLWYVTVELKTTSNLHQTMEPQIDLLETKLRQSLNGRHFGDKSKMKAEIKKVFAQYDTS